MFNKIDALVKAQERLKVKKQKVDDKRKATCSAIGDTIQRLEDRAFVIKQSADNRIAVIERKLKKIKGQLALEIKYNNSIAEQNND